MWRWARLLEREPRVVNWKGRSAFGSALLPAVAEVDTRFSEEQFGISAGMLDFSLRGGPATKVALA